MQKLKLVVESLRVESYSTSAADGVLAGTVHGHDSTGDTFDCTAPKTYKPTMPTTTSGTWTQDGYC